MRCPICDQTIDLTQGRASAETQSCPVCRAICRDADEAEQSQRLEGAVSGLPAEGMLIPAKRTPGVEDVFNWY